MKQLLEQLKLPLNYGVLVYRTTCGLAYSLQAWVYNDMLRPQLNQTVSFLEIHCFDQSKYFDLNQVAAGNVASFKIIDYFKVLESLQEFIGFVSNRSLRQTQLSTPACYREEDCLSLTYQKEEGSKRSNDGHY